MQEKGHEPSPAFFNHVFNSAVILSAAKNLTAYLHLIR